MIRVLHNIGSLANGGMESFILNLYRHVDTSKVQFDFVVGTRNEWCEAYAEEIRSRGGRVFSLCGGTREQVRQFREILREHPEYGIVHSHRDANSVFFLWAARQMGVKARIVHSHSASETGRVKHVATCLLRPALNALATVRLACGRDAGEHLFHGYDYRVFPNAIDIDSYLYSRDVDLAKRKEIGLQEDDVVIGHVGRFVDVKNHGFLVEVFRQLQQRVENAKLLLVGAGPLKEDVKRRVQELGLEDKVVMLEQRSDVNELLQAMDLVVFPSKYEGFSMAMVEMQAAGLRILSSDKVPHEINVTGSVTFKPLEAGPEKWAEEAEGMLGYERSSIDVGRLKEYGLDVKESARQITDLYLSLTTNH